MTFDVLIIGGGPAGATTAILLAEAGWSVGLIEKKEFPRKKFVANLFLPQVCPFTNLGIGKILL